MPRNGSGTQSSPAASFPAVAGTLIESSKFNNVIDDINASLTASISNDGQTPILANIPMNGFKFTGLTSGSSSGDSVEYGQYNTRVAAVETTAASAASDASTALSQSATKAGIQAQTYTYFTTGGSSGTYTLTPSPALASYVAGQRFSVKFSATGSGSDTINVNSLGAKNIKQYNSSGVKSAPNIILNQLTDIEYDGTDFVIINPIPPATSPLKIAQVQYDQDGTLSTGSVAIPPDNTIPQITEGTQFMSLAITPTNASSTLEIDVTLYGSENSNTSDQLTVALFKDSGADAIAAGTSPQTHTNGLPVVVSFKHFISAGSTSAQTFTVRAGLNNANQFNFNGGFGGQVMGGVLASSIKITEYLP